MNIEAIGGVSGPERISGSDDIVEPLSSGHAELLQLAIPIAQQLGGAFGSAIQGDEEIIVGGDIDALQEKFSGLIRQMEASS